MNDYSGGIDWEAISGALPDAPGPNHNGGSSTNPTCTKAQHQQPQDYSSGQHHQNEVISTKEYHLQRQIEKLHNLIAEKDAKLFEMESSMASIEAEADYKIAKAERDASNQIKATQDELRRVQKEVDTKSLTIVKMKKRKLSNISVATNQALTSAAKGTGAATASASTSAFVNNLNDVNWRPVDAPVTNKVSNNVSPIQLKDATATSSTGQPKTPNTRITTVTPVQQIHEKKELSKGPKPSLTTSSDEPKSNNNELSKKLLMHLNMLSMQLSLQSTEGHGEQKSDRTDDCDNSSAAMTTGNVDGLLDELKIRHLINLFTIEKMQLQTFGTSTCTSKEDCLSSKATHTAPSISITTISKELICLIVSRSHIFFERDKPKSRLSGVNSSLLKSLLISLSTLNEICISSSQARYCIRKWICDSHEEKDTLGNSFTNKINKHHSGGNSMSPQINCHQTSTRIRGVSMAQKKKIEIASDQIRNIIPSANLDYNSVESFSWDGAQRTVVCQNFLAFLSNLVLGSSQLDNSTLSALEREHGRRLQSQCVAFLLVLTHDVPQESSNYKTSSHCEAIWGILFDQLFPPNNPTNKNSSAPTRKDFFSAATIGDKDISMNRRFFLLEKGHTSCKAKSTPKGHSATRSTTILSDHLAHRILIFQLLYHILLSSKDIRRIIFQRKMKSCNPSFRGDVSMAKAFFAVTLDELQINILPRLKQHDATSTNSNICKKSVVSQVTSLAWYITRLLSILCETKAGLILIQTQMMISERDHDNKKSDAASGIAVLIDVLEFSVHALIQSSFPGNMKQQWSEITNSCIAFFYYIFSHYHKYFESSTQRRKDKNMFSLMLYDAERLSSFQSCCKLIISFDPSISTVHSIVRDVTKKRARIMLYQILEEGS